MSIVDASMSRELRRELAKHPVDTSQLEVHVIHGVAYLRGRLDKLRGYYEDLDLEQELTRIIKALRNKPGIRDVVCEVELGGPTLRERLAAESGLRRRRA
ncbi:MAG: hypothetical protein QHI38_00815 [Armatimonadota bacterium]|nr:hypothetical protein [Armatimonadota bacterium]